MPYASWLNGYRHGLRFENPAPMDLQRVDEEQEKEKKEREKVEAEDLKKLHAFMAKWNVERAAQAQSAKGAMKHAQAAAEGEEEEEEEGQGQGQEMQVDAVTEEV
ncbi:hypothetical protein CALCODRAFT_531123, partial [Calocera cornea HHB12733]